MSEQRIGLIGLGNMGRPMATLLVDAGHDVVGFDVAPSARQAAGDAGIPIAASVVELAATCDIVILMLPSSDIVDAIAQDLLDAPDRCMTLLLDMSSSIPDRTVALAERCAPSGVAVVDAPVSGGVLRARTGDLTIMVGGSDQDVARVQDVLDVLGGSVVHVGAVGTGHATKALNNLLSATHLLATNEAVLAAQTFGIDPAVFLDVVNTSSGRSGSSELKLPRFVLSGRFDSGFSAALLDKDVRIAIGVEQAMGVPAPVSEAVGQRWSELTARLEPGADHTAIIRPVEQDLGREVRATD
ncbi:NAD(P)-dependent oxidoreductase [Tersicoccus sp. Bi-70]|uniref:NAD(P)-dependent oxidoreductase n=1 Tax=Tersicoccus sp. Bi-70 TaxID=1897634 RepID=UPI00097884F9|nr:NAD(P)-dependent oxidoreductase [Tersicoccus sp. Bi-70]OMH37103.1 hypothetical protein BGP79_15590 [Tersicoccus sp. Bi-70]